MIVDRWDQIDRYLSLHPGFAAARDALQPMVEKTPEPGKYVIDGERLFILVAHDQGRGPEGSDLEFHRRYIDIQLVLAEHDMMGWRALAECQVERQAFDASRDIGFYADAPSVWIPVVAHQFAIFFPQDAHAPLATRGKVLKAVAKVANSW